MADKFYADFRINSLDDYDFFADCKTDADYDKAVRRYLDTLISVLPNDTKQNYNKLCAAQNTGAKFQESLRQYIREMYTRPSRKLFYIEDSLKNAKRAFASDYSKGSILKFFTSLPDPSRPQTSKYNYNEDGVTLGKIYNIVNKSTVLQYINKRYPNLSEADKETLRQRFNTFIEGPRFRREKAKNAECVKCLEHVMKTFTNQKREKTIVVDGKSMKISDLKLDQMFPWIKYGNYRIQDSQQLRILNALTEAVNKDYDKIKPGQSFASMEEFIASSQVLRELAYIDRCSEAYVKTRDLIDIRHGQINDSECAEIGRQLQSMYNPEVDWRKSPFYGDSCIRKIANFEGTTVDVTINNDFTRDYLRDHPDAIITEYDLSKPDEYQNYRGSITPESYRECANEIFGAIVICAEDDIPVSE